MSAIGLRFLEAEFLKLRLYYLLDVRIAWVFPTKILMIFWRPTKRCCARVISVAIGFENDFCACPFDFSVAHVSVRCASTLCLVMLRFIDIKDGGAILLSSVWSLVIDLGRIMRSPEEIEQFVVACLAGIKSDLYCLGTLHIAGDHRGYASRLFKNCVGAPKITPSEIGDVCLVAVRLRAKCHAQDEDQIVRQRQRNGLGFTFGQWRTTTLPHSLSTFRHRLM